MGPAMQRGCQSPTKSEHRLTRIRFEWTNSLGAIPAPKQAGNLCITSKPPPVRFV